MKLPRPLQTLIAQFERLPGIGPRSAQRLAFYLLHVPESEIQKFADALVGLKKHTVLCSRCHHVGEEDPCEICNDTDRDTTQICVVEQPLDLLAIERSGKFAGVFHVLHGAISPLNSIGPDQLFLRDLSKRMNGVKEVILATNPTMEGEATAMFIQHMLADQFPEIKITRIGHGLPIGADIEYADGVTIARALEGRRSMNADA